MCSCVFSQELWQCSCRGIRAGLNESETNSICNTKARPCASLRQPVMQQQVKNHSVKNCHCCRVCDAISCFSVTDANTERREYKSLKCSRTATALPVQSLNSLGLSHTHIHLQSLTCLLLFTLLHKHHKNPNRSRSAGTDGPSLGRSNPIHRLLTKETIFAFNVCNV